MHGGVAADERAQGDCTIPTVVRHAWNFVDMWSTKYRENPCYADRPHL